jgi:hypothetical protein
MKKHDAAGFDYCVKFPFSPVCPRMKTAGEDGNRSDRPWRLLQTGGQTSIVAPKRIWSWRQTGNPGDYKAKRKLLMIHQI